MRGFVGAWEKYWATIDDRMVSPWDADHENQASGWVDRVSTLLPDGLPLVDVACGSGNETACLVSRFGEVLGVDISPTVIGRARALHPTVDFRVLDILDPDAVAAFTATVGPANVWTRFLLHHLPDDDTRLRALSAFGTLTGGRGLIFNRELLAMARDRVIAYARRHPIAQTVYNSGIRPGQLAPGELPRLYRAAALRVLATGRDQVFAAHSATEGAFPIEWVVAGPGSTPPEQTGHSRVAGESTATIPVEADQQAHRRGPADEHNR